MENAKPPESQSETKENKREKLTRTEFEELVRRALLDDDFQEYEESSAQADTIAYTPSPHCLVWEQKFLANPLSYARRQRKKIMQVGACAALALTIISVIIVVSHEDES